MLHRLLLHLLPVLHPAHTAGRTVELSLEAGGRSPLDGERGGELDKVRRRPRLAGNIHHQGAGGETLADVVESFAGVGARILGEDLSDVEAVHVARSFVLEILAGFDLLLIMEPHHVEPLRPSDGAAQDDRVAVLHQAGLDVADYLGGAGAGGSIGGPVDSLLLHRDDDHLGGGLYAALGVGGLAGELSSVLWEDLVDDDTGHPIFVLDLHHLVGGDGLPVLHPGDLGVRVSLHLDLQLHPGAVLDGELWLQSGEEGRRTHQGVVRRKSQLLGVAPGPRPSHRVGAVRPENTSVSLQSLQTKYALTSCRLSSWISRCSERPTALQG